MIFTDFNLEYMPKGLEPLIIKTKNDNGIFRFSCAVYVGDKQILEQDFMDEQFYGEGSYDEETDNFFTPEGFYENSIVTDINWKISSEIVSWCYASDLE